MTALRNCFIFGLPAGQDVVQEINEKPLKKLLARDYPKTRSAWDISGLTAPEGFVFSVFLRDRPI
jgi:hypothetical protein